MRKEISRRSFLKGTAAGAVGVAALGVLNLPVSAQGEISWDEETDVIVVGAGSTGLCAGAEAAKAGAKVRIFEKAGFAGGTTNFSGGFIQASATRAQKEYTKYQDDSPEKHAAQWIKMGEGIVDEELVTDLAYGAPGHIAWLEDDIGLKFTSVTGISHIPYVEDELMADRVHGYEGGGGNVLIMALLKHAEGQGAQIDYDSEVTRLYQNADKVIIGAEVKMKDKTIKVKANKGVVLAAASIDNNKEMAKRLSPQHYWDLTTQKCLVAVTNTGDGIRMGMEVGADVMGIGGCIDFCGKTYAGTSYQTPLFPSFIVNQAARRFVCEDATYGYHYRAIFQQEKQLNGPTYMIFGKNSLVAPGMTWTEESLAKDVADGVVVTADTIEALAEALKLNPETMKETLDKWNADMAKGTDSQFGRKTGLEPIEGPFYAYKNVSFNLGSLGGLRINKEAQVLTPAGEPIPHLYAGGMNSGGWIGPYYPGSGTAIMGTIHWGRKAGMNAAAEASI
ncbi:MAG: FAD-dependent oxidoreductase [Christensenellales bacterium]|jgi:urocanate reductase